MTFVQSYSNNRPFVRNCISNVCVNVCVLPVCSHWTPAASRSGSPILMSLSLVPRHSIDKVLNQSSASSSEEEERVGERQREWGRDRESEGDRRCNAPVILSYSYSNLTGYSLFLPSLKTPLQTLTWTSGTSPQMMQWKQYQLLPVCALIYHINTLIRS